VAPKLSPIILALPSKRRARAILELYGYPDLERIAGDWALVALLRVLS